MKFIPQGIEEILSHLTALEVFWKFLFKFPENLINIPISLFS